MAIKTKISAQSLVLNMHLGENAQGKAVFKNLSLKNVKPNAADDGLFLVANAVKEVLPYPVVDVAKSTLSEITEESDPVA